MRRRALTLRIAESNPYRVDVGGVLDRTRRKSACVRCCRRLLTIRCSAHNADALNGIAVPLRDVQDQAIIPNYVLSSLDRINRAMG